MASPRPVGAGRLEAGVELREARTRIRLLEQENEILRTAAAYLSPANLPRKG
jgi:transposase-like protein